MLKDGDISVEEAERLLEAIPAGEDDGGSANNALVSAPGIAPKRISVLVKEQGKTKVNVKVPFSLVRVGLKLGKAFGAAGGRHMKEEEAAAMELLANLDIDELLDSLDDGEITLPYTIVDVNDEEKDQMVEIIME